MMVNLMPLSDFVKINPKVNLKKGVEYPFVEMGFVTPGRRYVSTDSKRIYKSGGAKFQTDDTLFARITPCLENGKIVQFAGANSEIGFGSTEFFVFRHKEGISDPGYVFYLASSDILRKPAEKSMFGASGRQRADLASIKDLDIPAPPLPTQHKIASILSAYDDLIENNTRRIQILEEMAQALYEEWCFYFRYPGHENDKIVDSPMGNIPEEWEVASFPDYVFFQEGPGLRKWQWTEKGMKVINVTNILSNGNINVNNTKRYISLDEFLTKYSHFLVNDLDIVIASSGNTYGKIGRINRNHLPLMMNTSVIRFHSLNKDILHPDYLYAFLKSSQFKQQIESFVIGSAQPNFGPTHLKKMKILLPPSYLQFEIAAILMNCHKSIDNLRIRNANLRSTRDLLLPKLISGEVDVSSLDIPTGELT